MTMHPTRRLDSLRAALLDINPVVTSAKEYVDTQEKLIQVFVTTLFEVSANYTGPQLAKKLVHDWSEGHLNYDNINIKQLQAISADETGGLSSFKPGMPASALQAVLQVEPSMSPMWFCLAHRATHDPQWIAEHMQQLMTARDAFEQKFGFPPRFTQLICRLEGGEPTANKRKSPGWMLELQEAGRVYANMRQLEDQLSEPVIHLGTLLSALQGLQGETAAFLEVEDVMRAHARKKQIDKITTTIIETGKVCTSCFIEYPSNQARQSLSEKWYGNKVPFCGWCNIAFQTHDAAARSAKRFAVGDAEQQKGMLQSLRHRMIHEIKEAQDLFPDDWITNGTKKEIRMALRLLKNEVGQTKSLRPSGRSAAGEEDGAEKKKKTQNQLAALAGQLRRTSKRIRCEESLAQQCSALELAASLLWQ